MMLIELLERSLMPTNPEYGNRQCMAQFLTQHCHMAKMTREAEVIEDGRHGTRVITRNTVVC